MFTQSFRGHKPGETETPAVTATDAGIETVLDGLSPVMVAWEEIKHEEPEPQPAPEPSPVHKHTWSEPVWTWDGYDKVTVSFTCGGCNITQTERSFTADGDTKAPSVTIKKETTPATTEKEGKNVYTASVTFEGKTYTNDKTEILPVLNKDRDEGQNNEQKQNNEQDQNNGDAEIKTGWQKEAAGWKYYRDGKAVNGWQKLPNGRWYHFTDTIMDHGWYKQTGETGKYAKNNGKWYYLGIPGKKDSGYMRTGWLKVSGKWYYLEKSGALASEKWVKTSGKWYYVNKKGAMLTGWVKYKNKWYYLKPKTGAMQTSWVKSGGKCYYMKKNGAMKTGEWQQYKGDWYYLRGENKGDMLINESVEWKGKTYFFDEKGMCMNA